MVNQIMPQNTNVDWEFGFVYEIQKLNLHKMNGRWLLSVNYAELNCP